MVGLAQIQRKDVYMEIKRIVITGGPCSGKTTALAAIAARCQELGYIPIILPEAATQLILSGLDPTRPEFQEYILRDIMHNERIRLDAVRAAGFTKVVFIYDRGKKDGEAYVGKEIFAAALAKVDLDVVTARDTYDGVIFLDTAALGAIEHYTLENNSARRETPEEAIAINQRTHDAWVGTPHLTVVPNRPGETFEMKIHECLKALARILGVPEPLEKERKFLLHEFDLSKLPDHATPIDIVQTYLVASDENTVERVRARGQDNRYLYFHTRKIFFAPGEANEDDKLVRQRVYNDLLVRRDHSLLPIHKTRHCFVEDARYFELDVFKAHRDGLVLLEAEVDDMSDEVIVPNYVGAYTEVTEDPTYGNKALAQPV